MEDSVSLVAQLTWRDLLSCAKRLFVAAIGRLQTAQQKIDALFGADYAREHPEVLVVVVQSAASDWAAARLAAAIEHVAIALAEPEETQRIVPARELLRPRP